MGEEAYENPLIPHARLREMYLAMLRARRLEESLPPKQRAWTAGLEACLVSPAINLLASDVISDAVSGATVRFLRGGSLNSILSPAGRARKPDLFAGAGLARALPCPADPAERLWAAIGAGLAIARKDKSGECGVALVYLRAGEGSPALRRRLFAFAAEHAVPAVFIVLPARKGRLEGSTTGAARKSGMPVIPVDVADAVAIYRVAQESIGRARAGGGPAAIECVPFVVKGQNDGEKTADPLANIERYILERSVVTSGWIRSQSRALASRLPVPVH